MDSRYFLALAVLIIMGWFAVGIIYTLRTGDAYMRWLQGGLPRIGEKTTMRWLGTSVAHLVIAKAKKPFKRLEVMFVFSPRDVPWMWVIALLQGRRDTLILRSQTSTPPAADLELVVPTSWTGRQALVEAVAKGWESRDFNGLQLLAPPKRLELAAAVLTAASSQIQQFAPRYWRISLRKENAQFEIHVPFPSRKTDANQWLADFQNVARSLGAAPATETPDLMQNAGQP